MKQYHVAIRCDIGHYAGMGHYIRCNLIKNFLVKKGIKATCYVKDLEGASCLSSLPNQQIIRGTLTEELDKYYTQDTVFIIDMLHKGNVNHPDFELYLDILLKQKKSKVFLLEGLGSEACPEYFYSHIAGLFTPYLQFVAPKFKRHFGGEKFLLIDPNKILTQKDISKQSKNVLISFGGVDLFGQNVKTLSYLVKYSNTKLSYKIIVSPFLESKIIDEIALYKQYLDLEIIFNPNNFLDIFAWADIAITNTGQTRYELAASGVPFIIMPFDQNGYQNSVIFQELGIAELLALDISGEEFVEKIESCLGNPVLRRSMSQKGQEFCCNAQGADNIANQVIEVVEAHEEYYY